jgi:hypothetical protein
MWFPFFLLAQFDGQVPPSPAGGEGTLLRGGMEITAGAQALHTYDRMSGAGHVEFAWRGPGRVAHRKGAFSIGVAASFHPLVGRWDNVPMSIGHVRDFNLKAGDSEPRLTVGGAELRPKELFLASTIDLDQVFLTGQVSLSPGAEKILVLDLYQMRDVRMDMWGLMVPVRWHFGEDKAHGARFFAEAGMGVDVLRTQATYDLTRTDLSMSYSPGIISFSMETDEMQDVAPLDGKLASSLVFTRAMVGGGMDLGRFRVFLRVQHTVSQALELEGANYRRVRGNVLALPVIAEAWKDPEVAATLDAGGVVPFGTADTPRNTDNGSAAQSSDRVQGVDRFWDRTQALLGVAFRLR